MSRFGSKLREAREKKGWTQEEAGKILGLSIFSYNNLENKLKGVNFELLEKIQLVFEVENIGDWL